MVIYPAIDLLDGKCVRLKQGKYDKVTVYSDRPEEMAVSFREAGSQWVHVVDLNAARSGGAENRQVIERVVRESGLKVQTGGGIRNFERLQYLIEEVGVSRCVIGTSAVKDRDFTEAALSRYGQYIAIGLDAKDDEVAVDGWTRGSGVMVADFVKQLMDIGARMFIYTDISKDGTLQGPAVHGVRRLVAGTGAAIIASGGVGSFEDIESLRVTGCEGVIVGKAIYEGKVRLEQCWRKE